MGEKPGHVYGYLGENNIFYREWTLNGKIGILILLVAVLMAFRAMEYRSMQ